MRTVKIILRNRKKEDQSKIVMGYESDNQNSFKESKEQKKNKKRLSLIMNLKLRFTQPFNIGFKDMESEEYGSSSLLWNFND